LTLVPLSCACLFVFRYLFFLQSPPSGHGHFRGMRDLRALLRGCFIFYASRGSPLLWFLRFVFLFRTRFAGHCSRLSPATPCALSTPLQKSYLNQHSGFSFVFFEVVLSSLQHILGFFFGLLPAPLMSTLFLCGYYFRSVETRVTPVSSFLACSSPWIL